jgi:outer membrane protein insertion porin family
MTSIAAQRRDCLHFGVLTCRFSCVATLIFLFAIASHATARNDSGADPSPSARNALRTNSDSLAASSVTSKLAEQAQPQNPASPPAIIERIDFTGNRRIRSDTLKARIFSREGDVYNEETLRRDFQALWNTQFFEDIKLRVEDSPDRANAKIIVFDLVERPVIRRIRYDGIHSVTESEILDRFKERKVGLTVESQFDPTRIKKAEVALRELLAEHGRQFAKVTPQYERIASSNAVILVFKITEGPKVKVGRIKFTGNHAFSDRKLIRAMRHDRPFSIPLYFMEIPVLSKTYDRDKLNEDLEVGVRGLYQDNGYFRVLVKDPILENVDTTHTLVVPGIRPRTGKVVNITIPIEENDRYRMGTLKIVSADPDKALSLKVEALKSIFPLKPGDVFATGKVRKALKTYGEAYGEYGFIDFTPEPQFDFDDSEKKINVTLKFDEQKQYYVRRIDFSGNTTTRDKVIRRELLIDEGQLFNKRAWEMSVLRLNQLDYFERIEAEKAAEIKRNSKEGTVDITLKLKEKGKQSIGLQGGVSGLAGSFLGLTYQTNNFLGLGETLTFSAQFGSLTRSFQFGFTEPYLFDRPIATGFTIFSSRYKFDQARQQAQLIGQAVSVNPQFLQNYNQDSSGFTAFASYPLRRSPWTRLGISYGLTKTNITAFNESSRLLFTNLQFRSVAGPSALNGIVSSTITPTITYNTVSNPVNPTSGKSYFYSLAFSGLGGNVKTIDNVFDWKWFRAVNKKRNVLAFHGTAAFITGFGGGEVPPFSRFYIGGENDLRGFDVRSLSPVTFLPVASALPFTVTYHGATSSFAIPMLTYTATLPGGDTQAFGNVEYRIPIVGPVTAGLFFDAGTVGIARTSALHLDTTGLADLQSKFGASNVSGVLPIAPGTNFRIRGSTGIEFVVQLPIIQAPFRIYYAYNINRLYTQLAQQSPFIDPKQVDFWANSFADDPTLGTAIRRRVDDVRNTPVFLNDFEPRSTIKFTVSRTF